MNSKTQHTMPCVCVCVSLYVWLLGCACIEFLYTCRCLPPTNVSTHAYTQTHTQQHADLGTFFFFLLLLLLLAFTPHKMFDFSTHAALLRVAFVDKLQSSMIYGGGGEAYFNWKGGNKKLTWEDNGGRSAHNTEEGAIDGVVVARIWRHFALFFVCVFRLW